MNPETLHSFSYAVGFISGALFTVAVCYREVQRCRRRTREAERAVGAVLAFAPDPNPKPDPLSLLFPQAIPWPSDKGSVALRVQPQTTCYDGEGVTVVNSYDRLLDVTIKPAFAEVVGYVGPVDLPP
jgi:hypothetical protein